MNKINNKLIIFGLGILAILAFSVMVFVPTETKAYSNGDSYWRYQASPNLNGSGSNYFFHQSRFCQWNSK